MSGEFLREHLKYEYNTGNFIWIKLSKGRSIGNIAGCLDTSTGYIRITFKKKLYSAHRLAWYFYHKEWPDKIDHINGIRNDNRIENLRNGNYFMNNQNLKCHREGHLLGTSYRSENNTWRCKIKGTRNYRGVFKTQEEAYKAYKEQE